MNYRKDYTALVKIAECALNGDKNKAIKSVERYITKFPDSDLVRPFVNLLRGENNPDGLTLNHNKYGLKVSQLCILDDSYEVVIISFTHNYMLATVESESKNSEFNSKCVLTSRLKPIKYESQ